MEAFRVTISRRKQIHLNEAHNVTLNARSIKIMIVKSVSLSYTAITALRRY